jgi:hypothetical protein
MCNSWIKNYKKIMRPYDWTNTVKKYLKTKRETTMVNDWEYS